MTTGTQTRAAQKGYRVKVVGTYFARSPVMHEKNVVKNYEFEANIPTLTAALSIVKNKLLNPMLSKKYPDFVAYKSYHIINITPLDEKSRLQMKKVEVQYMDRPTLIDYIDEHALPVESKLYPDLFDLRVAVQEAKDDPDGYLKKLDYRRADLEMNLEISDLNPGLHEESQRESSVSIANRSTKEVSPGKAAKPKKKLDKSTLEKQTTERVGGLRHDMIKEGEHGEAPEQDDMPDI